MLKFRKASADEVRAKRKQHVKDLSAGTAMLKGFKAPPSWNDDTRSAKFIMSSESVDRYRDIVVQSGIDTTAFEKNPQGLLFHNSRSWPIGLWSDITKVLSGRPKRLEGVLNFLPEGTDEDADRAARHVKAGSMRTVSIGFIPDWEEVDFILDEDEDWTGGFRFNKCELIECSLVPVPAQPDALVKDVGGDFQLARDLIEDILDTYTKTPEGLLVPLDSYRQTHAELSGNPTSVVVEKSTDADEVEGDEDEESKATPDVEMNSDEEETKAVDEIADLPPATAKTLVARGMVFSTELKSNDKTFGGHVIAKSIEDAEAIVAERGLGEVVIGAAVDQADKSAVKDAISLAVTLDVDHDFADAKQQLEDLEIVADRIDKKFEGVFAKIVKFFGGSPTKEQIRSFGAGGIVGERKEPELEVEPEVKAPPTEEERAAARRAAAEALVKLRAKGMIAPE